MSNLIEGYHSHNYVGNDIRLLFGEAREFAFDEIVFEKRTQDGVWWITKYAETVYRASELPEIPEFPMQFP